ncbi:hypothetical protein HanOQP8_Chr02g0076701 [Helianthus annuus]|nr:hypothetical protein HanIR_Chr02g0088241 [Helianthus annuus]KAJ0777905.1 hypothetical protein HanLR1_Chr02g0065791 [Helianthus annuus]KAJ0786915.1 hypothetical protein HanOQP8_Chr02g0076701 [Helianthus annuus]
MIDEEEENEPPGPRGPRQRYYQPHREISGGVANFVTCRRTPGHANYNRGLQAVYDNVSAAIGENWEYEERRRNWEQDYQAQIQAHWGAEDAYRAKELEYWEQQQAFMAEQRSWWDQQDLHREQELACRQAWEQEQDRLRIEQNVREDKRWSALATIQELAVNNAKHLHDQERHQRDYMAGPPYSEHTPWTCYENHPVPHGPSDPSSHWPEGVGSSFIPPQFQQKTEGERGPLDDYWEMFESLTGYPYHPYPPVDPNERYQR